MSSGSPLRSEAVKTTERNTDDSMKALKQKILSLILIMMLAIMTLAAASCGNNQPIDESRLPDLEESTEPETETGTAAEEQQKEETAGGNAESKAEEPQNVTDVPSTNADNGSANTPEPQLSEKEALAIVFEKIPGASDNNVVSFSRDFDDGRWTYEGEVIYNGLEYDFEIDAQTGNILEWEIDD